MFIKIIFQFHENVSTGSEIAVGEFIILVTIGGLVFIQCSALIEIFCIVLIPVILQDINTTDNLICRLKMVNNHFN